MTFCNKIVFIFILLFLTITTSAFSEEQTLTETQSSVETQISEEKPVLKENDVEKNKAIEKDNHSESLQTMLEYSDLMTLSDEIDKKTFDELIAKTKQFLLDNNFNEARRNIEKARKFITTQKDKLTYEKLKSQCINKTNK